ncbi:TPA: DUF2335 domain-containing protein [Pseudomonas aeruginosa]|uniref:DUF2335 domain-containing protein n=1 Tax=Pseudomonas aeruginosa TaxID=287 RepID=UPI0023B23A1B|nr:DUF2335 domain-containing protein [Pseudomonas aeruginosa]MDE9746162.1 DUF2335 domain-containing protein [Pseudomonas aeruginosa]HEJ2089505.1 DUF2335 domain-containing protein [Pseudomonas aeruginosa]HEJ2641502.1 DUF2335 domain-containing protein [Pseudomonas aeruginosa]HEJ4711041.1 DUF2335 domain-containing protein [Pseudomonas aeruginosa]
MSQKPRKHRHTPQNHQADIREGVVEREQAAGGNGGNGQAIVTRSFKGPLPAPSLLKEYDSVVPGLAEKIVDWTTTQTSHRQEMEARSIRIDEKLSTWYIVEVLVGLILGFLIALLVLAASVYLALHDRELAATALGGLGFGSMVIAFITGRRKRDSSDDTEKATKDQKAKK